MSFQSGTSHRSITVQSCLPSLPPHPAFLVTMSNPLDPMHPIPFIHSACLPPKAPKYLVYRIRVFFSRDFCFVDGYTPHTACVGSVCVCVCVCVCDRRVRKEITPVDNAQKQQQQQQPPQQRKTRNKPGPRTCRSNSKPLLSFPIHRRSHTRQPP